MKVAQRLTVSLGLVLVVGAMSPLAAQPAEPEQQAGGLEQTQRMVAGFRARFSRVGPELAENLDQLYSADVRFRDPISTVSGLDDLRRYFAHFAEVSHGARFEITDTVIQPGEAALFWTMTMLDKHGKPERQFGGVSHLKVGERIYEERDYFDLGEAVYDHVPVVSWFTSLVRSRLQ